ncbi:MAG: HAMP domain-containing histidine kinase [Proteobacteria bacterium]|nr:HAMP domain-containing histidine kinase [Pseudomonadota bacterium]
MILKRDPSKALQLGFLALLAISTAQVAWWVADQRSLARLERDRVTALYEADALAVAAAFAQATPQLAELMPHLEIDPELGTATVRPESVEALVADADSRINRYTWEGGFFLLVLIGGMAVLTRTIRHDAQLRKRQQNFLAAVSHELKSPLASIRLAAETLIRRPDHDHTERLARRMLEDGERLLRMVENLLDTTRLEEGRMELRGEALTLSSAVTAGVARYQEPARSHGVDIHVDVPDELRIEADPVAIETVLRNLLDNAVKACVAGQGRNVWIDAQAVDGVVRINVRDDGSGFAPDDAAMIFEKFYRLGDEMRRSTSGTGLGLYLVRGLADISGARVSAASEGPGLGATVTVEWPAAGSPE